MGMVLAVYLFAVVLAIVIFIVYGIKTKTNDANKSSKIVVSNCGEPIIGGMNYFKLVNR